MFTPDNLKRLLQGRYLLLKIEAAAKRPMNRTLDENNAAAAAQRHQYQDYDHHRCDGLEEEQMKSSVILDETELTEQLKEEHSPVKLRLLDLLGSCNDLCREFFHTDIKEIHLSINKENPTCLIGILELSLLPPCLFSLPSDNESSLSISSGLKRQIKVQNPSPCILQHKNNTAIPAFFTDGIYFTTLTFTNSFPNCKTPFKRFQTTQQGLLIRAVNQTANKPRPPSLQPQPLLLRPILIQVILIL